MMNYHEDCCCYLFEKIVVVQMESRYHAPLQFQLKMNSPLYDYDPSSLRIVLVKSLCRMMMMDCCDCALGSLVLTFSRLRVELIFPIVLIFCFFRTYFLGVCTH